jgi:biopolymer transport protein ExbB
VAGRVIELLRLRTPTLRLSYIARVSPLLGLAGSILGLIQSFGVVGSATAGAARSAGMASGVALALVGTLMGIP